MFMHIRTKLAHVSLNQQKNDTLIFALLPFLWGVYAFWKYCIQNVGKVNKGGGSKYKIKNSIITFLWGWEIRSVLKLSDIL